MHREFCDESLGERILKVGPHLPKLLSNGKWLTFLRQSVHRNIHKRPKTDTSTIVLEEVNNAKYTSDKHFTTTHLITCLFSFCRATLCIARPMPSRRAVNVCLSIRLSIKFVYCIIETSEHILKLFFFVVALPIYM